VLQKNNGKGVINMARPEDKDVAKAMKQAKTAREKILSWGTQRPGSKMDRALNVLRAYVDRKPEMIETFAHNQLTQVTERGILDAKTRYLVLLGIYMSLRHWQGINAQCCNARAAGCTEEEIMEVAFLANYGASKMMLVESSMALADVFESPTYKSTEKEDKSK